MMENSYLPSMNSRYDPNENGSIVLLSEYTVWVPRFNVTITVPKGYRFDASVPDWRLLRLLVPRKSLGKVGVCLHDFLYEHQGKLPEGACVPYRDFSKKDSDLVFLDFMKYERVSLLRRTVAYLAVRLFGRGMWDELKP